MTDHKRVSHSYIIGAKRSPVAPRSGVLSELNLHQLATPVIQSLLTTTGVDPKQVDQLIVGNALGAGGNPARLISLASGLDQSIAGVSIDTQCCSGLDALLIAKDMVASGRASVVIAGGVESYSQRPQRFQKKPGTDTLHAYDQPAFTPWPEREPNLAVAAHDVATKLGISFDQQNQFAIQSHEKALAATTRLSAEIVPIAGTDQDAYTRKLNIKLCERAARLHGSVSIANTAVAADGAAFCLVVNETMAAKFSQPKLRIRSGVTMGSDPMLPGLAPVSAIDYVLNDANMVAEQLQRAEIMEAYAAQAIACIEQSGINKAITNTGGGALARGHAIGASGAVLMVRLFSELNSDVAANNESTSGLGIAAIAAAGGLGSAVLVERV